MPTFTKGDLTLETSHPNEISELRARGFTEVKSDAPAFDAGAELPAAPVVITNDIGRAEGIKPASKSTK